MPSAEFLTKLFEGYADWTPKKEPNTEPQPETVDYKHLLLTALMRVAEEQPKLKLEYYDMVRVEAEILEPIADYLRRQAQPKPLQPATGTDLVSKLLQKTSKKNQPISAPELPIVVSGDPGIGKTFLLKAIDKALSRLELANGQQPTDFTIRKVVGDGQILGYYGQDNGGNKGVLDVTPLRLFEENTAVLRISDWQDILKHWTDDPQQVARANSQAVEHLLEQLKGKVVFVDDIENIGHSDIIPLLRDAGILMIISSNFHFDFPHSKVHLAGEDHRTGDISQVCIAGAHPLFDKINEEKPLNPNWQYAMRIHEIKEKRIAYASWDFLKGAPLLVSDFARFFKKNQIKGVLLDDFPFFSGITVENIDDGFIGSLYRFVYLLDALNNLDLPFMLRMKSGKTIASDYVAQEIQAALATYDKEKKDTPGAIAWTKVYRCLSRLRSREEFNAAFFPALMTQTDDGTAPQL